MRSLTWSKTSNRTSRRVVDGAGMCSVVIMEGEATGDGAGEGVQAVEEDEAGAECRAVAKNLIFSHHPPALLVTMWIIVGKQ